MPLTMTYGDVRQLIEAEQLGWQPRADMPDYVRLPDYALGASTEGLVPTADAPALDLRTLGVGTNPFLAVRRFERGIVSVDAVLESFSSRLLRQLDLDDRLDAVARPFTDAAYGGETASAAPPEGGTPPNSVDWRNRWGQNWITSTRDQNPCNSSLSFVQPEAESRKTASN